MGTIRVVQGDITQVAVDAIVNAANSSLLGGGGVDGAIHRVGGPAILEDCRKIIARQGGCDTGQAVITGAGRLPAKFVIHTVGPIWRGGSRDEDRLLADCYRNSLQLAWENSCKSVAFPNISTGIYCFPKERAAAISLRTIRQFLERHPDLEIQLVCFEPGDVDIIQAALSQDSEGPEGQKVS